MFKTNFSGHSKIWREQKDWVSLFPNAPRGYEPGTKQREMLFKAENSKYSILLSLKYSIAPMLLV